MSKKRTPLWHEAHFEVKSVKNWRGWSTFGRSDLVFRGRRKGFCMLSKARKTWGFCSSFNYNHHYTTLHSTLHYNHNHNYNYNYNYNYVQLQLRTTTTTLQIQLHYSTLHYTNYITRRYTILHSTPLHHTTLHYQYHYNYNYNYNYKYITLHYTTLH